MRPTPDRVREALFSILGDLTDATVLDLFAGTGAVGFEALSRGAKHVTAVEKARLAADAIEANRRSLGVPESSYDLIRADIARVLPRLVERRFDLIFADPPYAEAMTFAPAILQASLQLLSDGGRMILEHARRDPAPESLLELAETRVYGDTALSFYVRRT